LTYSLAPRILTEIRLESITCREHLWLDMRKGTTSRKTRFSATFQIVTIQEPWAFLAWFISSLGLLLHRSNVRSCSKPPVPSGELPKRGIKRRFSNAIDALARPSHTGNGRGSEFAASVVGWWKNIHARFQVHSCYGSRDINVLKQKFGKCAKWSLFSYPVTFKYPNINIAIKGPSRNYNIMLVYKNMHSRNQVSLVREFHIIKSNYL
jgi:hypothetical protein